MGMRQVVSVMPQTAQQTMCQGNGLCVKVTVSTNGAELLGGDGAIAVLVEEGESLLELRDLLLGKL